MGEQQDTEGWYAAEEEFLREERIHAAGVPRAAHAGREEKVSPGGAAGETAVTALS